MPLKLLSTISSFAPLLSAIARGILLFCKQDREQDTSRGKINRAIGNEWFRTKVSTKLSDKTGYVDSNYPIASDLVKKYMNDNKPYWCKKDIEDATVAAGDRIADFIFGK